MPAPSGGGKGWASLNCDIPVAPQQSQAKTALTRDPGKLRLCSFITSSIHRDALKISAGLRPRGLCFRPRGRPFQPDFSVGDLFVAMVELDIASTRTAATQVAAGEITVGQLNLEYVIATRLTLVARAHARRARLAVDRD